MPARRKPTLLGPQTFHFLNVTRELKHLSDWEDSSVDKLWVFNLHYFDDLNALDAASRLAWHRALLLRWVHENPPGKGTGWDPYPTSLRIVNWIKWALTGNTLPPECLHSLAVQTRWLARRLEVHLLGNHLFANAKALIFAGLFFDGEKAIGWLKKGFSILEREISEQILPDGGQFERSPMYHSLALEDMLDLSNVSAVFPGIFLHPGTILTEEWSGRVGRMRQWLTIMSHPDGEISFFNDSAIGTSPSPAELEAYAQRLDFPSEPALSDGVIQLAESGYIRIQRGGMVALLDVALVGPDYLPGHAHADTLSFELSLFGQRVFVNSGTSCYGAGAERLRQRGTAAHNTVVVNGRDSSEVWGGFRVARRARPTELNISQRSDAVIISCAHDGYEKLTHSRKWLFGASELVVEDSLSGSFRQAEARYHLHPSVTILKEIAVSGEGAEVALQLSNGQKIRFSVEGGVLRKEASTWHPEFGRSEPNYCLFADFQGSLIRTRITWGNRS